MTAEMEALVRRIVDLANSDQSNGQIAKSTGLGVGYVKVLLSKGKKELKLIVTGRTVGRPRGSTMISPDTPLQVSLSVDHVQRLTDAAIERGMTPTKLLQRIVSLVIKDNMIKAVLDD